MTNTNMTNGSAVNRNKESKIQVTEAWWKESSVYQIYPSSFKDSNGDGIGDIPGVISKLDYIQELGVDMIWMCPCFESPRVDEGYDISDYRKIYKPYGTMEDVDRLIEGLHSRGMKLLMDLVANHTSDQHEWFKASRSSKTSPYRDWYIWKSPRICSKTGERQPPNNWTSHFGGSAWEYDEASHEYYLHLFAKEQPDLNWETPAVRDAIHDIMRFWLEKGADGFRLDVINYISKDQAFPDDDKDVGDAVQPNLGDKYYSAGPRLHEYLKGVGQVLQEYKAFSVGEMPGVKDVKEVLKSVASDRGELAMIFQFEHVNVDHGPQGKFSSREWDIRDIKRITTKWQRAMIDHKGWNANYQENHDQPRSITRYCTDNPKYYAAAAKMLATHLVFQCGTTWLYQGSELGMVNVPKTWKMSDYRDLDTLNHWSRAQKMGKTPEELAELQEEYRMKSRDNARTPMQWDTTENAGFTDPSAEPWLKLNPSYKDGLCAANQVNEYLSPYKYWSRILKLKKKYKDVLVYGDYKLVGDEDSDDLDVMMYERIGSDGQRAVIICNWKEKKVERKVEHGMEILEASYGVDNVQLDGGVLTLRPFEAVVGMYKS